MSELIKAAQQRLMAAGFPLPRFGADGDFGQETAEAFNHAMDDLDALAAAVGAPRPAPVAPTPYPGRFLNAAAFAKWAPKAVPGTHEALEATIAERKDLQDGRVLAHWLGQMWVESAGFSTLTESLNYSVDGLLKTFGRHRISAEDARKYGRDGGRPANQEAIANLIYGGKWGRDNLGNTEPGDGWRFRGSGVKQITGRYNTEKSGYTPEELRGDIHKSVKASADFFINHGCVAPARANDVDWVTRIINGGTNGLADRKLKTKEAFSIII